MEKMMKTKLFKVEYYEWSFNRYGDKEDDYVVQYVGEQSLADLKTDKRVTGLRVIEETTVEALQEKV